MKMWKMILPVAALSLISGTANAQSGEEQDRQAMEARKQEYSERLREAEERMERAAREISEITRERLPNMVGIERRIEISNTPRIGITIDGTDNDGPVEGVEVRGVTPGTAADDGGLRAGDIITAVNDGPLSAENSMKANKLLLEIMQGVEEGEVLKVEFLRNGNMATLELLPRVAEVHAFSWAPGVGEMHIQGAEKFAFAPEVVDQMRMKFVFPFAGGAWGDMELVELNEGLGRYFGTDSGLLVVSAPELDGVELQDGDVIQTIDGREPTDVRHALRILSSYEGGEKLKLGIMRDKKKRTLDVEVPANLRGSLLAPPAFTPASVPVEAVPPVAPPKPVDVAST